MKIFDCKTNHMTNPLGFYLGTPRVSWKVSDTEGKSQKNARIYVSETPDFTQLIYDFGVSEEASSLGWEIPVKLRPYTRYYWKVAVEADNGEHGISETSWFETAKPDGPWDGQWIGYWESDTQNPVFCKDFFVDREVEDARIYVCGLGVYEVFLNGEKCGDEYLAPGCNDYNMWLQYQTYEVRLKKGENHIEASLGNGWYKSSMGFGGPDYGSDFRLILEIRKGEQLFCATDASWTVRHGDIISNSIYNGEWYAPGSGQKICAAKTIEGNGAKLMPRLSLPVRIKEKIRPKELIHTPAGEWVLDMGQNMTGFVQFVTDAPKGAKIRLLHGEILQEGNFYNKNLRSAKAEYVYISDGQRRLVSPHFTYYGFRYVKVEGLSDIHLEDFTGCILYSDLEDTGTLTTDHPKINQLISNIRWGQKSNFLDFPTDCPQRDERMGWTCDAQVFLNTACFNMDSYAFYSKYLWDMAMTQKEVGCVTEIIPAFGENTPACSAWGDAATIMPWNLYLFYGDKTILQQQYECMKQWADYEFSQDEKDGGSRLWKLKKGFGDWLAMDHDDPEEMFLGATDLTYISTAYYYYSTMIVAQTARILGNQADYDRYFTRACEIKDAFTKEYVTASGRLAINTQTAYILALYMGLLPDNAVEQNADALEAKLLSNNGYLNTGFLGTAYICQVLSSAGKDEAAYRLLFNEGTPSWLYGVNLGATTVWERWNSLNPDGSISSEGMNSFNHYAYGSVMEWMYRYMAGINPAAESPGFKKAVLTPRPNFRLKSVEASLNSPAGIYTVGWHMETDKTIRLRVQVPFDCEARLILPFSNGREELLRAGSYEFHYKAIKPLGEPPEIDGPFNRLKECIPVRPLLDKYFAGWQNIPRFHGQDSLARLCEIPYLHLNIDNIDLLKKDVEKLYS